MRLLLLLTLLALPAAAQDAPAPDAPAPEWAIVLQPAERLIGSAEAWTPEDEAAVREHFARLVALRDSGVVTHAGRTTRDDHGQFGLVLVRAATEDEARALMLGDPAVARGVMTARLLPYRTALSPAD